MNKGKIHPKVTAHVSPELKEAMSACGLHPGHCLEAGIKYLLTADREACAEAITVKIEALMVVKDNLDNRQYDI